MGGWDGNANWNRDVLERIVALLFALAGLADLAAGAPFLRRRQVLGILSNGEAEARAFVIGMASGTAIPVETLGFADDAAHLAARLRALALLLCALLVRRVALPGAAASQADRPPHETFGLPVRRRVATPPPALDTS